MPGPFDGFLNAVKEKITEVALDVGKETKAKISEMAVDVGTGLIDGLKRQTVPSAAKGSGPQSGDGRVVKDGTDTPAGKNSAVHVAMTPAQENSFLQGLSGQFSSSAFKDVTTPQGAIAAVHQYLGVVGEVVKFCELQQTKRAGIESQKQQALAGIEAQKTVLLSYLEKTFDERRSLFSQYFRVVDDALQKGDMNQLTLGLDSIGKLAASSPFKSLADLKTALNDKSTVWEI